MNKSKNSKTKKTVKFDVDGSHCTAPAAYAMRAECQADCVLMRAVLGRWLTVWREDRCYVEGSDGVSHPIPDVDIVFSMRAHAPSLEEIRWLLDCLIDCHVAAQSLNHASEYTGERVYDKLPQLMRRPGDEVVKEARECARRTKVCLRDDFGRIDDAVARLSAELGSEGVHLGRRARHFARMCKQGFGPDEFRNDDAKALAYGRAMAMLEWEQRL